MSDLDTQRRLRAVEQRSERLRKSDAGAFGGTSFPTGIASGFVFFRSDLGFECYYDGSQWLTTHEYTLTLSGQNTFSANGTLLVGPLRGAYSIYVTQVTAARFVSTTNNATNYWTIQIRGLTSAYGGGTVIATTDTSAIAAGTWSILGASIGTANPSENAAIDVNVTKSGAGAAPGNLILSVTVTYRLIVT